MGGGEKGQFGEGQGWREGRRGEGTGGGRTGRSPSYFGDKVGAGAVEATRLLVDKERPFLREGRKKEDEEE